MPSIKLLIALIFWERGILFRKILQKFSGLYIPLLEGNREYIIQTTVKERSQIDDSCQNYKYKENLNILRVYFDETLKHQKKQGRKERHSLYQNPAG